MRYICLIIAFFLVTVNVFSQAVIVNSKGKQIYLKGIVKDQYTNQPVGVNMMFKDSAGVRNPVKSNSITGMYQVLLEAGGRYSVTFQSQDIVRKEETFVVEPSDKYAEQEKDFIVRKLYPGLKFDSTNIFVTGSAELSNTAKEMLDYYQEIMNFNRSIHFEFFVSAHDLFAGVGTPAEDAIKELVDKRIKVLSDMIANWKRLKGRITLTADYSAFETEEDAENVRYTDLMLLVKDMVKVLE